MLAFAGVWLLFAMVELVLLLVRMPAAWVDLLPHPLVLRGGLVLFAMLVLRGVGTIVYTRLPAAAFLSGRTTERFDALEPHYRGLVNDKGRLVVLACHNTDLGDGWERADIDARYFREMSQRLAYPMGVNIVVYALTR